MTVSVELPSDEAAVRCRDAYFREIAERFSTGFDPDAEGTAPGDADLTPPAGYFVVARIDGRPVGCGGLRCSSDSTGEIVRMWTHAEARGRRVAAQVMQVLEDIARDRGIGTLRLVTNEALPEAQALYRRVGFHEVQPFSDYPYAHHWFEKKL